MREKELLVFEQAKKDFEMFRSKLNFTINDEEQLAFDVAGLIGWYRIDKNEDVARLIEAMLNFGESKRWSMVGARVAFEKLKK